MPSAATTEQYKRATETAAPSYRSERFLQIIQDSAIDVNVRVPMSLHPSSLDPMGAALVDGDGGGATSDAYASSRHALRTMYVPLAWIDAGVAAALIARPVSGQQL